MLRLAYPWVVSGQCRRHAALSFPFKTGFNCCSADVRQQQRHNLFSSQPEPSTPLALAFPVQPAPACLGTLAGSQPALAKLDAVLSSGKESGSGRAGEGVGSWLGKGGAVVLPGLAVTPWDPTTLEIPPPL